ncbi:hypothetical protein C8J56DRAFT_732203, partial [Mycena floridula]
CSNCGAIHTPLWRWGLNDELSCNACDLYCKLVSFFLSTPRPKEYQWRWKESEHSSTRGYRSQCYNCHTMMTPLWRKDDEGKTVCNTC